MRILFVEDDQMNRRVVRDMLGVAGLDMSEAPEAEAGLRMIDDNEYDLILMDLRMPGMDGLTAIRSIRSRGDAKATLPIIVVTADMAANIRDTCLDAGADDVILKPVAMDRLFDAIGRMVASRGNDAMVL
ncbi:MAG: response regulator [Caulobacter sp. 12-67-6]|nr:MAG: response regulator [Caulobacter sp. 12-67-6]OYX72771.1 MAG: response regulator [Caulobacter sp. 32-67-35]